MTAPPSGPKELGPPAEVRLREEEGAARPGPRLQAGGSLGRGAIYVERAADRELFEGLLRGGLCYVLATRQIGKSSLRAKVAERLRAEGVRSAHVDLTALGVREATAEGWYFGLTAEIADQLGLPDPEGFWDARKALGPVHVFSRYLEEVGRTAGRAAIFIDEIDATLALLQRQSLVETWYHRKILAGEDWKKAAGARFEEAEVILLLVSADFIASDYAWDVEVKRALARHEEGKAIVVPILLRPCDWQSAPFAKLKALPEDGTPVTRWIDQDEAWVDITQGLRRLLGAGS